MKDDPFHEQQNLTEKHESDKGYLLDSSTAEASQIDQDYIYAKWKKDWSGVDEIDVVFKKSTEVKNRNKRNRFGPIRKNNVNVKTMSFLVLQVIFHL